MSVIRLRRCFPYRRGQVATYLVVWVAVMVVLGIVLMNIGQVALIRTATANAADSAALGLASNLGSLSRRLCAELGTPNCEPKCTDEGDFVVDWLVSAIIIVVAIALAVASWGTLIIVSILLIAAAVAMLVSSILKYTVIQAHQIAVFNELMNNLPLHGQFREQAIFTGFTQLIDDPRGVPDNDSDPLQRDIDHDGDTQEMVGAFAKWWHARLMRLNGIFGGYRNRIRLLVDIVLQTFLNASRSFRNDTLGRPNQAAGEPSLIGVLGWLEGQGYNISFWQPGFQSPERPGAGNYTPCEPGVTCVAPTSPLVPDEVDWMNGIIPNAPPPPPGRREPALDGSLLAFEQFSQRLINLRDGETKKLMKSSKQWLSLLKGYWMQNMTWWSQLLQKWIDELSAVYQDMCSRYGGSCMPPGQPTYAGIAGHPLSTWAIPRLTDFKAEVDRLILEVASTTARQVSRDRPIYKWADSRGWHLVRVEVGDFEVPELSADQHIIAPGQSGLCTISGGCMITCVGVANLQDSVRVTVTRLDQDRMVNRGMWFKTRDNTQESTDTIEWWRPAEPPGGGPQYWDPILDRYGITSRAIAFYSHLRDRVQLQDVR